MIPLKDVLLIIIGCFLAGIFFAIIELIFYGVKNSDEKNEISSSAQPPLFKPTYKTRFNKDGRRGITKRGGITGDPDD